MKSSTRTATWWKTVLPRSADGFAVEDKNISDSNLPLYVCKVNGETKYVIPVTGKGLWDAIWGYVALNADKNTIMEYIYP